MEPNIDTITIGATDFGRTLDFYEQGFGFPVEKGGGDCVTLGLGGSAALELCPWDALAHAVGVPPKSSGFRGFTLSYIVGEAPDVDDVLVRLVEAGGAIAKEPRFAFWGYSAHVADPSGHLWKIASPKRRSLIARRRADNGIPQPVPARELALTIGVADMTRAKEFYAAGLGNTPAKDYSKFVSFTGGDGAPDLAMYRWDALADDAGVPPAGSGFRGFRMTHVVDPAGSVEALAVKAERAGGKVSRQAGAAYFADPDGYFWKIVPRA